jgi:hypothetical protein
LGHNKDAFVYRLDCWISLAVLAVQQTTQFV